MATLPPFNENNLESIARILGESVIGVQLDAVFDTCGIKDTSGESTKWKRIRQSLLACQRRDGCGNNVAAFIQATMSPGRFVQDPGKFERARHGLNVVLSFDGLQLDEAGRLRAITPATTITEAQQRAGILAGRLQGRLIHPEVVKYCGAELLQEDYFHAVLKQPRDSSRGFAT